MFHDVFIKFLWVSNFKLGVHIKIVRILMFITSIYGRIYVSKSKIKTIMHNLIMLFEFDIYKGQYKSIVMTNKNIKR